MNRRGFFATLAAAAATALLPRPKRLPYEAPKLTPLPFRVRDIREAVATLRANNIEAGADGMLEVPLFVDDDFQRLNTALPRYTYRRFSVYDLPTGMA